MDLTNTWLVATQVLILFIIIALGYLARKTNMVEENGLRQMSNILVSLVMPAAIINSFLVPYDAGMLTGLLISAISAVGVHLAGILLATFLFRRQPDAKSRVLRFSVIFANCSFFAVPLISMLVGSRGIVYASAFIAVFNIMSWTYGVLLMTGRQADMSFRRALINPGTLSVIISLPIYLLRLEVPSIIRTVIGQVAFVNSPLAMLIVGGQLATIPPKELFYNRQVLQASLIRLLAVPLATLLVLHLFPLDRELMISCLVPAAAPVAAMTAIFADRFQADTATATHAIAFSTLLTIFTIPLLIFLSDLLGNHLVIF
jgi:malate permease and related proteins